MGLFDPPSLQQKTIQRPVYKYPKNIKRKYFLLIYLITLIFWTLTIVFLGGIVAFIVLPFFVAAMQPLHSWIVLLPFVALGGFIGSMMSSLIVGLIIQEGIKAGDITKL